MSRNPLLPPPPPPQAPPEPALEPSPVLGTAVSASYGPPTPLHVPSDVPTPSKLAVRTAPLLWVVGVHGGAGTTTVAQLVGEDVGELTAVLPRPVPPNYQRPRVVFVARAHAAGLGALTEMARYWASGQAGIELLGVVVVDDGPKLPKSAQAEIKHIGGMVPTLWHLPWHEPWRTVTDPTDTATRRARKTATQIRRNAEAAQQPTP